MKITKKHLQRIISEEFKRVLSEQETSLNEKYAVAEQALRAIATSGYDPGDRRVAREALTAMGFGTVTGGALGDMGDSMIGSVDYLRHTGKLP